MLETSDRGLTRIDAPPEVLYDEGDGEDDWVVGYSRGDGLTQKRTDHLLFEVGAQDNCTRVWITDNRVDVTNHDYFQIDIDMVVQTGFYGLRDYGPTDDDGGDTDYQESPNTISDETDGREKFEVDISDVSGDYYIGLKLEETNSFENEPQECEVYGVRLTNEPLE